MLFLEGMVEPLKPSINYLNQSTRDMHLLPTAGFFMVSIIIWIACIYAAVLVIGYFKRMAEAQEAIHDRLQDIASELRNRS